MRVSERWDQHFLAKARLVSNLSKDPSTQVGAVIARGKRPLADGFNGFSENIPDRSEWLQNREEKYDLVIHAEENAILAAAQDLSQTTLYVWPFPPCIRCMPRLDQAGIRRVVFPARCIFEGNVVHYLDHPRWSESFAESEFYAKTRTIDPWDWCPVEVDL